MSSFIFAAAVVATGLVALTVGYGVRLTALKGAGATPGPMARNARRILALDGLAVASLAVFALWALLMPGSAVAQEGVARAGAAGPDLIGAGIRTGLGYVGAGLSTGAACIGAGIGVGIAGAAGIGAISEKPEMLGRSLIYVGLAEGTAIYGLLISFMILNKLG